LQWPGLLWRRIIRPSIAIIKSIIIMRTILRIINDERTDKGKATHLAWFFYADKEYKCFLPLYKNKIGMSVSNAKPVSYQNKNARA
jgi:hypothetical protein